MSSSKEIALLTRDPESGDQFLEQLVKSRKRRRQRERQHKKYAKGAAGEGHYEPHFTKLRYGSSNLRFSHTYDPFDDFYLLIKTFRKRGQKWAPFDKPTWDEALHETKLPPNPYVLDAAETRVIKYYKDWMRERRRKSWKEYRAWRREELARNVGPLLEEMDQSGKKEIYKAWIDATEDPMGEIEYDATWWAWADAAHLEPGIYGL